MVRCACLPMPHPYFGPCVAMMSNTWRGFSSHENELSSLTPLLPPDFGLTKISSGQKSA